MTFISYAQNFEDVLLWRALQHIPNGFYIDVGASHPDTESVTRAFYDRGWSGVNIEPVGTDFRRLQVARARDVNLNIALGAQPGSATFFVVPGTGLSTLETRSLSGINSAGFEVHETKVEIQTLAQICHEHVVGDIHFLKIDVEGSERAVLLGSDFNVHRPWIVIVEATAPMSTLQTHIEWEGVLLAAGYQFVWFDGLNRFYVSEEHARELAPHFSTPVNVFDDFIRVADTEWAMLINKAEARAAVLADKCAAAERHQSSVLENAARTSAEKYTAIRAAARLSEEMAEAIRNAEALRLQLSSLDRASAEARTQMQREIEAIHKSTSWQVTWPIRRVKQTLLNLRKEDIRESKIAVLELQPGSGPDIVARAPNVPCDEPANNPASTTVPFNEKRRGLKHAVHQFHAGSAVADAITNAMLLTQRVLRSMGYASEIFVVHRDPLLEDELRLLDEIPRDDDYVLIVRHSMGFDGFDKIAALPAAKILLYHNITPAELLAGNSFLQAYSHLGREQLRKFQPLVTAALADSDYNAIELHALGFSSVQTCMMLVDTAALRRRAMPRAATGIFTILFVGRVMETKGQLELLRAFQQFRAIFDAPSQLVLVGKYDVGSDYFAQLNALADNVELRSHVTFAGMVSDAERDAYYAAADLYVSLSSHEGFGVPLVEAMANGVPVLAWPCGAVPYTLGKDANLLPSREAETVAAQMLSLARDPALRARIVRQQYRSLTRFDLENQQPALANALAIAGAYVPADSGAKASLQANIRFVVTGHLTRNYSLATVNRTLASAIEKFRPGAIRVVPVEEERSFLGSQTPSRTRAEILRLVERPKEDGGPVIVISQHYPVLVPAEKGNLLLALFFWEESVVPAETIAVLSQHFAGVIAPSRFVAKVLVDSGLSIPIFQLEYFPDVSAFRQLPSYRNADGVFTFLHVSSCFPRKGIDILLQAFARTFRLGDKVRLIIKGFPNPHNTAPEQAAAFRAQHPDTAEIIVIDEDIEERGLVALYAQADAIVLPTRGEGFNLPAAEALAAGKPLIVTGYGGHMDFCGGQNVRFIDYRFAKSGSHFTAYHSVWVEPDVEDLAAAMATGFANGKNLNSTSIAMDPPTHSHFNPDVELQIRKLAAFAVETLVTPVKPVSIAWVSPWNVHCGIAGYSKFLVDNLPESNRITRLTILADNRSKPENGAVPVVPCWQLHMPDSLKLLLKSVTRSDADIVVIQHQPGLMAWGMLGDLLTKLKQRDKLVTVTLHNTFHLLDIGNDERSLVLNALAGVDRVIVHTISDLNRLKKLHLVDNVVMMPQGAPERRIAMSARLLSKSDVPVVGCYGFFLPGKGIPQLIKSLSLVHEEWPTARLRLVNADYGDAVSAMEIQACKDIVAQAGLQEFIEWHTEFLPNEATLALLAECDLIALPYQGTKEASSAAMRTALCAGPPVVVTPIGIFDEADDAVLRLSGITIAEIATGLKQILSDQKARQQSQDRADIWMASHSWTLISKRMQGMLLGLANATARNGEEKWA